MKIKVIAVSAMAVAVMGFGILLGSMLGAGGAAAQTPGATTTAPPAQTSGDTASPPAQTSGDKAQPAQTVTTKITKEQAEQAALTASPGNTIDHTRLGNENGTVFWDVDFTNGGGVEVNADTGAIIATEAAGTDNHGGHRGGADQAALAAKAKITKEQAESTALTAAPGSTIDHSRLGDDNGTVFWDVDFTNDGGVTVNAETGAVIATEAPGTDNHGGRKGGPPATQP